MAHHPLAIRAKADSPIPAVKERVFITSVEVIEFSYLLEQNENTSKWGWLFRTNMHWDAVAFVLSELCLRPSRPGHERTWKAVESVFDERILEPTRRQKGMLWKSLWQLWTRAKAVREKMLKSNGWNCAVAKSPGFSRAFDPNGSMPAVPAPPTDGNEMRRGQCNLGVTHNTADALGLDMGDFNQADADHDLKQPLPRLMDMEKYPDGTNVMSQADPMVQNWLANDNDTNSDMNLQINNDFLWWSGWSPGLGDFALGADPMASFPIVNTNLEQGGAQELPSYVNTTTLSYHQQ